MPVETKKRSLTVRLLSSLVHGYRLIISPIIGPRCRFLPTCSDYALDALAQHGAIRGGWLTLRRLARCHPLGGSGFDPVPDRIEAPTRHPAVIERQAGQCRRPEPMV
ncbi:MAG: membrane protein insertion efficiency factor YidD [Pseudomonadota bacterium]